MRTPLNKSHLFQNPVTEQAEQIMNPELQKVMNLANSIKQNDPDALEKIRNGIEKAREEQEQATKAKETAETEEAFNKACDDAIRAREKEAFFLRLQEKYMYTPKLEEEEYFRNVDIVKSAVKQAADNFRKTAKTAIAEIIAAKAAYLKLASEADIVLIALDKASNVLQSKYRYKVTNYTDGTETKKEDSNNWFNYATRFLSSKACEYACYDLEKKNPSDPYDKIVYTAWRVAERIEE